MATLDPMFHQHSAGFAGANPARARAGVSRKRSACWPSFLAALLLTACGHEPADGTGGPAYDFVERLPFADIWTEVDELNPVLYENRRYLARGWSVPRATSSAEVEQEERIWASDPIAEVSLALREKADRILYFQGGPFELPGVDAHVYRVSWNGRLVHEGPFAQGGHEIAIPQEAQNVGINRLTFDFGSASRPILTVPGSNDTRQMAANIGVLSIEVRDASVHRRALAAREMLPRGVQGGELAQATIMQTTGSLLWYHLQVPENGAFRSQVLYARRRETGPAKARFEVYVTPHGGQRQLLAQEEVDFGESASLAADLRGFSGQVCRFEFCLTAEDGGAEPLVGWWARPEITGVPRPAPVTVAPDAMASVRTRLARAPVILFLLDATNPSYLSSYGGRKGLTPNLDRLAAEGVRFENAYSQAAYTISSVPTTLTSRYAWDHGAWQETTRVLAGIPTWPEAFRKAGYQTHAIVCSPNGSSLFGNEAGFERYVEAFVTTRKSKPIPQAEDVEPILARFVALRDRERPMLLWVHIIEPHEPYQPPAPWAGSLTDPDYTGRLQGHTEDLWAIRNWQVVPTRAELEHLQAQYEENLAYVDHVFGRLRARLEKDGLFQDAVVAVFSDHGEGFLTHSTGALAGMGHGSTVYGEMTRIPLIVRLPEGLASSGIVPSGLVANMDLFPTVADLVGVPELPAHDGQSFAPLLLDPTARSRSFVLSHTASLHPTRFLPGLALWADGLKYIHTSGHQAELYDLALDPAEQTNLATEHAVLAGYMRQRLRELSTFDIDMGVETRGSATELDEEAIELMQALGYGR